MARTLIARVPRLFRTRSCVPNQNCPITADMIVSGIISDDLLFYIDNGMLCVLIRIASMRQF